MNAFLSLPVHMQIAWLLCGSLVLLGLLALVWPSPSRPHERRREVILSRPDPKARRVNTTTQHWWA